MACSLLVEQINVMMMMSDFDLSAEKVILISNHFETDLWFWFEFSLFVTLPNTDCFQVIKWRPQERHETEKEKTGGHGHETLATRQLQIWNILHVTVTWTHTGQWSLNKNATVPESNREGSKSPDSLPVLHRTQVTQPYPTWSARSP